jgi:hypothetical protein
MGLSPLKRLNGAVPGRDSYCSFVYDHGSRHFLGSEPRQPITYLRMLLTNWTAIDHLTYKPLVGSSIV